MSNYLNSFLDGVFQTSEEVVECPFCLNELDQNNYCMNCDEFL